MLPVILEFLEFSLKYRLIGYGGYILEQPRGEHSDPDGHSNNSKTVRVFSFLDLIKISYLILDKHRGNLRIVL